MTILFVDPNLTDANCHGQDVSHLVFNAMYGCFVWWSFNFPTFPAPTFSPFPFPLSPFPFPLSPFPFPKCIFAWPLLLLTHFPHCPVVVLKVVFIFVLPCF